jgi:UDP-N-acetylglucosamine acyltransferase
MSEVKFQSSAPAFSGFEADSRANISPRARIGAGVTIGAWAVVGDDVELGPGCQLMPHAVVMGPSKFGSENVFYPFSTVGADPQDLTYKGERTELIAGDANQFRECCTVTRGTNKGGGTTRIGSHNLFMNYSHVGHDSQIGDHTIFVNGATLAGHVTVGDYATIGAFSPVHQFCRIGQHAYVGACTVITQDVPPFSIVVTERETRTYGANKIGLERKGFSADRIRAIEQAFRVLSRSKLNTSQAVERMRETLGNSADVQELIAFIQSASRGLVK